MSGALICALGRASYSIFALHMFASHLIPAFIKEPLGPVLQTNLRWIVLVPVTLVIAWLAYRYVETPINRLKRHFTL